VGRDQMAPRRPTHLVLWALLSLCIGVAAHADERRYLELVTEDFTVYSGVSEQRTREIATQVAMFRAAIEQSFGVTLPAAVPMRIHALPKRDWEQYVQPRRGVAGYFVAQPFSCDLIFDAEDESGGAHELMFHEYMHYILRTFWAGEVPPFLDEGLAEVFSTARFENGFMRIQPRHDHVRFLRKHEWLPFERLLAVKRHDPEYLDHALAPAFYAQAWATVYYTIAVNPEFSERVTSYIRELNSGASSVKAAERLIGAVSAEANRDIATYIRKRRTLPATRLPVVASSSLETVRLRSMSEDETALSLGELMLRLAGHQQKAQGLFGKVLERSPQSTRARVGNAWALLQGGERRQAANVFDAMTHERGLDAPTRVALARGLFQIAAAESQDSDDVSPPNRERFTVARTLFEKTLDDEANRLEAINGYLLACLALEDYPDSLIAMAQDAYRVAPRSSVLATGLALLHELTGKKIVARQYWEQAARNSHTAPMRARALKALEED
jgi:tetratricopeptide (TPR) repeat protein